MKTNDIRCLLWTSMFYLLAMSTTPAIHADDHEHEHDHDHEHAAEVIAIHLPGGKELPFTDLELAQQHLRAVEALGCEASLATEGDVTTVTYRCDEWKTITVANHELAEQWMAWMKAAGFDTSHGHVDPVMLMGPEIVEFRLIEWKTVHVEATEVERVVASLEQIGCEVQQSEDGDHIDITFRSPIWREVHLPNHPAAEQWIAFFETYGFEVRHEDE